MDVERRKTMKNGYTHFISKEEMEKELIKISRPSEIKKGGIPLSYDDNSIYLDDSTGHNLIIGSTGSGKTQTISFPKIYTSILAGESLIIDDHRKESYETFKEELLNNQYKVIELDFYNFVGNTWNPLSLPYKLYKEGEIDESLKLVEKIAYYLFEYTNDQKQDPFWITSARNLFVGLVMACMDLSKNEFSICSVVDSLSEDYLLNVVNETKDEVALSLLKNINIMPKDTKGSVIAVFNHAMLNYTKMSRLKSFLNKTDFNMEDFLNEKVALFVYNSDERIYINSLFSLFIEEVYYVARRGNNKRKINILLDDFDDYVNFENFPKLLADSRSNYIEITILTRSLHRLTEKYGETNFDNILSYFTRVIYLYANDEYTLNYLSKLCGNKNNEEALITPTELKLLKTFESIVLKSRYLPFKTKLLPYFQYEIKK